MKEQMKYVLAKVRHKMKIIDNVLYVNIFKTYRLNTKIV